MMPDRAIKFLRLAAVLTIVTAFAAAVVAVLSLAQGHGIFSAGIGVMLLLYAAGLAFFAHAGWRGRAWSTGPLTAIGVLHLMVAASMARASGWWILAVAGVAAVTALSAVVARRDIERASTTDD